MKIGIADADLIGRKSHRFPNLASMKMSGHHKELGDDVTLVTDYRNLFSEYIDLPMQEEPNFNFLMFENINNKYTRYYKEEDIIYDKIIISKVFTDTEVPLQILCLPNCEYGGTGFFYDKAPSLPYEIEHHMPDYQLYDEWIETMIAQGAKETEFIFYKKCSIGKLTNHCFNQCSFCVNKNYKEVIFHSHVDEFYDKDRPYLIFLDDQFLGYKEWEPLLDEVIAIGKPFQFRQGLDIRLMTPQKAEKLTSSKYFKDFIFAFDNLDDELIIRKKLELWRQHTSKRTKLYTFCGYEENEQYTEEFWVKDIESLLKRIFILAEYDCVAYVMRHKDYNNSPYKKIYNELASWCNQPWALRTMTFKQFCIGRGMGKKYKEYKHDPERYLKDGHRKGSQWVAMEEFEKKYPKIAKEYFNKTYNQVFNLKKVI